MTRAGMLWALGLCLILMVVTPGVALAAEWAPGVSYSVGALVTYQGPTYKCLQAHTSQVGWEPPNAASLWQLQSGTSPTATPTPTPTPGGRATATPTPTPTPGSGGDVEVTPGTGSVTASANDGNVPGNSVDNNLSTRWAANGDGQWIKYDLGTSRTVTRVRIGWYNGNMRSARFDLQTSSDNATWTNALTGATSSGTTTQQQTFDFTDRGARYVRYLGHGNTSNLWNSILEFDIYATSGGTSPTATPTPTPRSRASATPTPTPTPGSGGINPGPGVPSGAAVPYVDVLAWPTLDVNTTRVATGHRYYTFAFIQSRGCEASVGGVYPMAEQWYRPQINALRAAGGDMVFSFGGAAGIELAQACTTVSSLVAAYQSAKNTYKITTADFDIEGAPLYDAAANDRRHKAIKQVGFSRLVVTLPTMPEGLTSGGLDLLRNAKANGVQYNVVNLMTMDYGGAYCGDMGGYAVQAISSVKSQLAGIGYSATVAATPMIGVNDVTCEIFQLSDATQVKSASPTYRAFWSINRDNGGCAGCGCAQPNCSGISQSTWAFTNAFK